MFLASIILCVLFPLPSSPAWTLHSRSAIIAWPIFSYRTPVGRFATHQEEAAPAGPPSHAKPPVLLLG